MIQTLRIDNMPPNLNLYRNIPLTQGKFTKVDEEEYEALSKHKWFYNTRYAQRRVKKETGKWGSIPIQNVIIDVPIGMVVDHINGDTLDNRKANLRVCTKNENNKNKSSKRKFKGVRMVGGGYQASITADRKVLYIGFFTREEDAARAYNEMALKHFGEFAKLNNVEQLEHSVIKEKRSKASSYQGVTRDGKGRWKARKSIGGKRYYLGLFKSEESAYQAILNFDGKGGEERDSDTKD